MIKFLEGGFNRCFYFDHNMFKLCILVNKTTQVFQISMNEFKEIDHKFEKEEETLYLWKLEHGYLQITPT